MSLPAIREAALPDRYLAAKDALAECSQIDECKEWADQAAAMASYARQAEDTTLEQHAMRIRARAVRRCGELIRLQKQTAGLATGGEHGGRPPIDASRREVSNPRPTLREAGISHKLSHQAQRIASIPESEFEAVVESEKPPTVNKLAALAAPPKPQLAPASPGFAAFTQASGMLREFAAFCRATDPAFAASGAMPHEVKTVRKYIAVLDRWVDTFAVHLHEE